MNPGINIKALRKAKDMTSVELAQKSGINQSYLSQIENGKRTSSLDVLDRIAGALNTTVSSLLGEESEPVSPELARLIEKAHRLDGQQIRLLADVAEALAGSRQERHHEYLVAEKEI